MSQKLFLKCLLEQNMVQQNKNCLFKQNNEKFVSMVYAPAPPVIHATAVSEQMK